MKVKVRKKACSGKKSTEQAYEKRGNALFSENVRQLLRRAPKTVVIDDCSDLR